MRHGIASTRPVVALALLAAACGGAATSENGSSGTPDADTGLEVTGTDVLRFEPDELSIPTATRVGLTFSGEPNVEHDFVVEGAADRGTVEGTDESDPAGGEVDDDDLLVVSADAGETVAATFTIDQPGTYEVYCAVPGHREAGMVATLTVEDDS
jgi:uncharacterized cupredoxin-like copper-binding protein